MAYKEPWNIYQGYPVNCDCESYSGSTFGVTYDVENWSSKPGNSISYNYDGLGNVSSAEYYTSGTLAFTITYTYDGGGNVTSITTS